MTYTLACDAGAYVLTGQIARRASSAYCSIPTATIWFPVAPGVTTLPAAPAEVSNPAPAAANQATLPPDWDDAAPDLCYLFQDILPTDQGPVFPSELTPDYVLEPFNETVVLLGITRAALAVADVPYELDLGTTAVVAVTRTMLGVIVAGISPLAGSYVMTGEDATLRVTYLMDALAGVYEITGEDAGLGASVPTYTFAMDAAAYTITGQGAGPLLMTADAGRYLIDGQPANLNEPTDPLSELTKLILHFDGPTGSTNFVNDAQSNTITAEVYGSARIVPGYAKWGTGAGRFSWPTTSFGYTGHSIAFDDPSLAPGTGDFTIECWIYIVPTAPILDGTLLALPTGSIGKGRLFTTYVNSTTNYLNWGKDGSSSLTQSTPFSLDGWVHVWCVRESGVVSHAVNGILSSTTVADTTDYSYNPLYLGRKTVIGNYETGDTYGFGGRIDDLRYTVGYARPLEVPTGPYPNV